MMSFMYSDYCFGGCLATLWAVVILHLVVTRFVVATLHEVQSPVPLFYIIIMWLLASGP